MERRRGGKGEREGWGRPPALLPPHWLLPQIPPCMIPMKFAPHYAEFLLHSNTAKATTDVPGCLPMRPYSCLYDNSGKLKEMSVKLMTMMKRDR